MASHERLIHAKTAPKSASVIISNPNGNSRLKRQQKISYSNSKSFVSLLPSPRRAKALSSARRLDTNDLEMELKHLDDKPKVGRRNEKK